MGKTLIKGAKRGWDIWRMDLLMRFRNLHLSWTLLSASFRSASSNWWYTVPPGSPASHKPWDGPPTWAQRINSSSNRMSWMAGWCARKQLGFGNWWMKWWFCWTCNGWAIQINNGKSWYPRWSKSSSSCPMFLKGHANFLYLSFRCDNVNYYCVLYAVTYATLKT